MIQHISNYQQNDKIPMFKSTETFRQPQQRNLVSGNFQHKVHCVNSISILPSASDNVKCNFWCKTTLVYAVHSFIRGTARAQSDMQEKFGLYDLVKPRLTHAWSRTNVCSVWVHLTTSQFLNMAKSGRIYRLRSSRCWNWCHSSVRRQAR